MILFFSFVKNKQMEEYVNNDTLIENQISKIFKASVTCPLCKDILINPLMCTKCQNVYCKKCIDDWIKIRKVCPNNCKELDFQECMGKKDILSKLQFRCIGCQKEIFYNEAQSHHDSCFKDKKPPFLKKINENEFERIKSKNNNDITLVESKN